MSDQAGKNAFDGVDQNLPDFYFLFSEKEFVGNLKYYWRMVCNENVIFLQIKVESRWCCFRSSFTEIVKLKSVQEVIAFLSHVIETGNSGKNKACYVSSGDRGVEQRYAIKFDRNENVKLRGGSAFFEWGCAFPLRCFKMIREEVLKSL